MLIKNITHHDMDGAGCAVIIKHLFKEKLGLGKVHRTTVSYNDTEQIISNEVSSSQEDTLLIITDVRVQTSFLKKLLTDYHQVKKILYVDHHEREDGRKGLEGLKYLHPSKFEYRWRKGYSATQLCYDLAREHGIPTTDELDLFVECVDCYDEWKLDEEKFNEGFGLNETFWELGFHKFFDETFNGLVWSEKLKEIVIRKTTEQKEYFDRNEKYATILDLAKDRKLLVSFNPEGKYTNLYTLNYEADLFLIFAYEKNGIYKFSIRSRNSYFDADKIAAGMSTIFKSPKGGGHKGAAGFVIPSTHSLEEVFEGFMENLDNLYFI